MGLFEVEIPPPPQLGVPVFATGADWQNTADLSPGWIIDPWDLYADGYKEAADQLVKDVLGDRRLTLDAVVYPIVFLYRHYLELRLKHLLPLSAQYLYVDDEFDGRHGLMGLWERLRPRLDHIWPDAPPGQHDAVEAQLREFEQWDKDSYAFRYPVNKKGARNLVGLDRINVRHLRNVVDSLSLVLDGSAIGIAEMIQMKGEMEAELRAGADW